MHVSVTVTLYQYLPEKWKGNLNNMWDQGGTDLFYLQSSSLKEGKIYSVEIPYINESYISPKVTFLVKL